jgi:hypothetical protein
MIHYVTIILMMIEYDVGDVFLIFYYILRFCLICIDLFLNTLLFFIGLIEVIYP